MGEKRVVASIETHKTAFSFLQWWYDMRMQNFHFYADKPRCRGELISDAGGLVNGREMFWRSLEDIVSDAGFDSDAELLFLDPAPGGETGQGPKEDV